MAEQEIVVVEDEEVVEEAPKDKMGELADPESLFFENLAEKLDDEKLKEIGQEACDGYDLDLKSISQLKESRDAYNKLFELKLESKNFPHPDSANVKLPIQMKATIQFASRLLLNIFSDAKLIKIDPIDNSPTSQALSKRVEKHLNFKLMYGRPSFYHSFRNTAFQLGRDGTAFRKVYWDSIKKKVVSTDILPEDFVINYYAKDLDDCYRYTHVLHQNENEIKIKQGKGIYRECELDPISDSTEDSETQRHKESIGLTSPNEVDVTTPRNVLEQHTYLQLKKDKYKKPYIVTVDYESKEVLRITRRSHPETGEPLNYFTKYTLIQNDKTIYGYGFGHLLMGLASTANSSINIMLDAGGRSTVFSGIKSKGSGMKSGHLSLQPGEFADVNIKSDDIRKAIFPLTPPPPSQVLLSLLQFVENQANSLSTVTEIFSGGAPKSDTTATAASIAVSEGAKLFTDIQKSVHVSLGEEFQAIKDMYSIYLDPVEYIGVTAEEGDHPDRIKIARDDYKTQFSIMPVSDPNIISKDQTVAKAQTLLNIVKQDPILQNDPRAVSLANKRFLEAYGESPSVIKELDLIYEEAIKASDNQRVLENEAAIQAQQNEANRLASEEKSKNYEDAAKKIEGGATA